MSNLDDKLKEILDDTYSEGSDDPDKESLFTNTQNSRIAQLKQAFVEAGWQPIVGYEIPKESIQLGPTKFMTGRAWYGRFLTEYKSNEGKGTLQPRKHAIEAAKKAAGLDD